jgi:hypothetical protein
MIFSGIGVRSKVDVQYNHPTPLLKSIGITPSNFLDILEK